MKIWRKKNTMTRVLDVKKTFYTISNLTWVSNYPANSISIPNWFEALLDVNECPWFHWPRFPALLWVGVMVNKHRANKWQIFLKLRNDDQLTLTTLEEESKSHQWSQEDLRLPDKISARTTGACLFHWWNSTLKPVAKWDIPGPRAKASRIFFFC